MLPPGHIAGGYLVTYSLINIFQPQLSLMEIHQLFWYGMFFGFAPDLDMFFSFFRQRSCILQKEYNHRKLYSHTPIVWLIAGGVMILFSQSLFTTYIGLLIWLAGWSHCAFDSLNYGIMWLFPFSKRLFSVTDTGVEIEISERRFFPYWMAFVENYVIRFRFTFVCEVGVVIAAVLFYTTDSK